MDREAEVLQDRVEVIPLDGRLREAQKGVGRQQNEEQERRANPGLNRQSGRRQIHRHGPRAQRHERAEEGEDQHPQEHGALMVAPDARDFIDEGLRRMGILDHVQQREIRDEIGVGQRREGDGD